MVFPSIKRGTFLFIIVTGSEHEKYDFSIIERRNKIDILGRKPVTYGYTACLGGRKKSRESAIYVGCGVALPVRFCDYYRITS